MIRAGKTLAFSILTATLLTGCIFQSRKDYPLVQAFGPDNPQSVTTAPAEATYLLYLVSKDAVIARVPLKAGEELGFKADAIDSDGKPIGAKGTVSAVAGAFAVSINPLWTYEWRRELASSRAEQRDKEWVPRIGPIVDAR